MSSLLAYFPPIYPNELFYSIVARYLRHVGASSPLGFLEALFGRRHIVASIDLPGSLREFAERLPVERHLDTRRLVNETTLFGYYTAFEPPSVQAEVRDAMEAGSVANLHLRLGAASFRVPFVTTLRFCPICISEMTMRYGELYWRRDHQLPSSLCCADHGCVLRASTVCVACGDRHAFRVATAENCPRQSPEIVAKLAAPAMRSILRLAEAGIQLLQAPPPARTLVEWTEHYRGELARAGLMRSPHRVDQVALERAFRQHHSALPIAFPMLLRSDRLRGDWLATLVRERRNASHPLLHLLLQDFLDAQAGPDPATASSALGSGPWPCRNPLAQHEEAEPISKVTYHRNKGHTVAVFSCSCGYVYTRSISDGKRTVGPPRFQAFGPLLQPAILNGVRDGLSLRCVSRELRIDPKTVMSLATELDIPVPWKLVPSRKGKKVKLPRASAPREPRSQKRGGHTCRTVRLDWLGIDDETLRRLTDAIDRIRRLRPPIRITKAEVERQFGKRGWLVHRTPKLPRTRAHLAFSLESVAQFQDRRIEWAISELASTVAPLRIWQVLRKAGLRQCESERVNRALAEYRYIDRAAA